MQDFVCMCSSTAAHPVHDVVSTAQENISTALYCSQSSSSMLHSASVQAFAAHSVTSYFTCFLAFHILLLITSHIEFSQYSPYSCISPPETQEDIPSKQ